MNDRKYKWVCPVCQKILYVTKYEFNRRKNCSHACRNKSVYHRKCNSESKKGKSIPWNKGVSGYTTNWKGGKMKDTTNLKKNHWMKKGNFYEKYMRTKVSIPSKHELKLKEYFDRLNIQYKQQVSIIKYQVDFLLGKKLVVEVDGDWHYKKGKLRNEDIKRDIFIRNLGYDVIHLKHREVDILC